MTHPTRPRSRELAGALVLLAALTGAAHAQDECDATTGSPASQPFLGPNGEQFYPENRDCPDRVVAPECPGGETLHYVDPADPNQLTRYACVSSPPDAAGLPLVVFLHGSRITSVDRLFGGGRFQGATTDFQALQASTDLGGPTPGYVLLMPQGRCLISPPFSSGDGVRMDTWYKDPEQNLDVRAIRAFIDQLETRNTFDEAGNPVSVPSTIATIDRKRVYLTDWSNGGYMSHLLALAFPDEFAAVASFASGDPYARQPCPTAFPTELSRKPGMMTVHAACDPILNCETVEEWVTALTDNGWSAADNVDVITDITKVQLLDGCETRSDALSGTCTGAAHNTYANPQLPTMFEFLKGYELP